MLLGLGFDSSSWLGAIFFGVRFFENQTLIDLLVLFRSVGVDVFSMGGYSSASLLMTQRNKTSFSSRQPDL
ncbi:hypothetical protein [Chitinibacter tainanensis]|uniref:hypothetical protein n=1 Tax=Chitinibacter tainanensis TaxID=230667 RepID=UPI000404AC2C|nr:hypothetical protein [Chitinibacter tainanensis]